MAVGVARFPRLQRCPVPVDAELRGPQSKSPGRLATTEVDAELLGRAEDVFDAVSRSSICSPVDDRNLDVEAEGLHLLDEHLEGLGDARLGDVLALHDGLVDLDPPEHVVGLDREQLLQRVRRAVGLERPHLHLAEALAAELRLASPSGCCVIIEYGPVERAWILSSTRCSSFRM